MPIRGQSAHSLRADTKKRLRKVSTSESALSFRSFNFCVCEFRRRVKRTYYGDKNPHRVGGRRGKGRVPQDELRRVSQVGWSKSARRVGGWPDDLYEPGFQSTSGRGMFFVDATQRVCGGPSIGGGLVRALPDEDEPGSAGPRAGYFVRGQRKCGPSEGQAPGRSR